MRSMVEGAPGLTQRVGRAAAVARFARATSPWWGGI
jgi:hypothetical protein